MLVDSVGKCADRQTSCQWSSSDVVAEK